MFSNLRKFGIRYRRLSQLFRMLMLCFVFLMFSCKRNPVSRPVVVPLPNVEGGTPVGVNFYETEPRYPGYLLCTYGVVENNYDPNNENARFGQALSQIRSTGRDRFPPIRYIAIVIFNRAEHKGVETFETSFKAGAVFDANQVFDGPLSITDIASGAKIDRHPFRLDTTRRTPSEQQQWLVVERDEARRKS